VIGRVISTGAPLGGTSESDPVPFDAVDANGLPVIPQDAHVRVAHAATPAEMVLRRPYSYDSGMHDGTNDVGLLFAAYMRDPAVSFVPMQQRIAQADSFNAWNTTIGSAAYLFPAGAAEGGYLAQGLFT
jgi:dye decolorizing peroxidase